MKQELDVVSLVRQDVVYFADAVYFAEKSFIP